MIPQASRYSCFQSKLGPKLSNNTLLYSYTDSQTCLQEHNHTSDLRISQNIPKAVGIWTSSSDMKLSWFGTANQNAHTWITLNNKQIQSKSPCYLTRITQDDLTWSGLMCKHSYRNGVNVKCNCKTEPISNFNSPRILVPKFITALMRKTKDYFFHEFKYKKQT